MNYASRRVAFTEIPVIDFAPGLADAPDGIARVAGEICHACENTGFLYISNHAVAAPLMAAMLEAARAYFALPIEEKLQQDMRNSSNFRGYIPLRQTGLEAIKAKANEAFQIQREWAEDERSEAGGPPPGSNQWPAALPRLRETMLAYFEAMQGLSQQLLACFEIGLSLPRGFFAQYFDRPLSMLRLLHYPPTPGQEETDMGIRPHKDGGAFTILLQDNTGGLEVQNKAGEWIFAPPIAGTFVINIGKTLQSWTNGRFTATHHRVINRYGDDRYSIPFFVNPNYDALIKPLEELGSDGERYEPFVSGKRLYNNYRAIWPSRAG